MKGALSVRLAAALILSVAVVLFTSCREKEQTTTRHEPFNEAPSQPEPIENSGKSLSGSYVIASITDEYAPANRTTGFQTTISFDAAGQFKREVTSGGAVTQRETGSYVIGSRGEFALYVEQVGSEPLQTSRVERYRLVEQSDRKLVLERGPGNQVVLQLRIGN